jgi:RNA polymerase sigma factor (sigma-70 family)
VGSVAAQTTTGEAQLYERNSALVYRYCLRMLGSREDAEDATQTTFFQALRAMRRGVSPDFERAWLLTIAKNECKSRYRSGSRRRERELAHDPHALAELATAPEGGDGRLVGVQEALARLPEMQRRALLLREWQGQSYAEIARELGASRAAVEALLFRARRGLARELGEETPKLRRHAFDIASLLSGLKSMLSGGAAVKLATVGVAAVATVGTVAVSGAKGPAPTVTVPPASEQASPAVAKHSVARKSVLAKPSRPQRAGNVSTSAKRHAVVGNQRAKTAPSRSTGPAASPRAEQPSTSPAAGDGPSTPSVPSIPVPNVPPPPPLPTGQLPQLPQVPQLPEVPQVPQVQTPELPSVPEVVDEVVSSVPDLPDLPGVTLP